MDEPDDVVMSTDEDSRSDQFAPLEKVPQAEFVAVEFPGVIRDLNNIGKAANTFGGTSSLEKTYARPKARLQLQLRPDSTYAHFLYGDRCATNSFLVELEQTPDGKVSAQFKVLPAVDKIPPNREAKDIPDGIPGTGEEADPEPIFDPIPPIFTRTDRANAHYNFSPNPAFVKDPATGKLVAKKQALERSVHLAAYASKPEDLPRDRPAAAPHDMIVPLIDLLRVFFQGRPIASRIVIEANTPTDTHKLLKRALPYVAYLFTDGPWRKLWIRLGYDPRLFPEARQYQTIDFRCEKDQTRPIVPRPTHLENMAKPRRGKPNADLHALTEEPEGLAQQTGNADVYRFKVPPGQQMTLYQVCDIDLKEVRDLAKLPARQCTLKDGWLQKGKLKEMRAAMKTRLRLMLDPNYSPDDDVSMVEASAMEHDDDDDDEEAVIPPDADQGSDAEDMGQGADADGEPLVIPGALPIPNRPPATDLTSMASRLLELEDAADEIGAYQILDASGDEGDDE